MSISSLPGHRRAFTLIELLVSIAIISMLAAILFPVFSRVRENARRTTCASNLKQIGMAMQMYTDDNDGFYMNIINPGTVTYSNWVSGNVQYTQFSFPDDQSLHWRKLLVPYTKTEAIFNCPTFPLAGSEAEKHSSPEQDIAWTGPRSYVPNLRLLTFPIILINSPFGFQNHVTVPTMSVNSPSQKILIGELSGLYDDIASPYNTTASAFPAFTSHNGVTNFLFCDGHVKSMKPTQTVSSFNMWGGMGCANRNNYYGDCRLINEDTVPPLLRDGMAAAESKMK